MSEYTLQAIASLKLCWVAGFALLYGLGGISNKWLRRFVGPLWMGVGIYLFGIWQGVSQWWHLVYPFLLCASLHLGYGGTDNVWIKLRKRAIYGLCLGISALPVVFVSGLWILYILHCVLCVASSVVLGVFNPTKSARDEETLIAVLSTVLVLFLI